MAHLPPVDWSRLVTTDDLDTRLQALRADVRSELRLEMARWGRTHVYTTIGAVAAAAGLAFAAAGLS